MTGIPRFIVPSQSGSIDPDATAWKNAVVTAGGSVSAGRLTLVSNLIVSLKSAGVWTKLDRLWLFAGENTQSATIDLAALQTAVPTNSPTFTVDRGYTTNGSSSYVDTNFNPSSGTPNYALNSAHMTFWNRLNKAATATVEMGDATVATGHVTSVSVKWSDGNTYFAVNDSNGDGGRAAPANVVGFWAASRVDSATGTVYQNGSSLGDNGQASVAIPIYTFLVGASRSAGSTPSNFSTCQYASASLGAGLDSTEVSAYYSALSTYMTAVGA
jgi:hypothetical protein